MWGKTRDVYDAAGVTQHNVVRITVNEATAFHQTSQLVS